MSVIQDDDRGLSRAVFVPDSYKGTSRQVRNITDPLDQLVSFIRGSTRDSLAEHAVYDTDYYSSKAQEIIDSHSGSRGYATSAGKVHGEIVGRISEFNQRLEKADVVRKRDRGNQAKARWRAGQRRDRLHGKIEELEKQVEKNIFGSNEVDNRIVDVDHDYGIDNAWNSYTHQKYELNSVVHEFERARRLGGLQPDDIALYEARIVELQQGLGKQVEYLTDEKNRSALVSFIKNEVLDISTEDEFIPEKERTTVYNDASSAKMEEVIQDLQRRKRATNDPQIAGMIDNQIAMALKFYNQITDEGDRYNLYGSTGKSVTRELNYRAALMWADSANLTGGVSLRVTDRSTEGSSFFRGLTGLVSGVNATDTGQVTFDVSWRGVRALDDAIAPRVDLKSINAIRALDEATSEKEALVRTLKSIGKFTAEKQEEVELIVRDAASKLADFLFYTARRLLYEAMNPESGQLHGKYKETKMNEIIRKIREQSLEHELSELDVVRMIKEIHGGRSGLVNFLNEVSVALSGTPEQLRYLIEQAAEDASTIITGDGSTPLSSASSSKTKSIIGKKINPVVQNMMDTIWEITQGRPSTVQRRLSKQSLSIQSLAEVEKLFMRFIRKEDRGQARNEFYRLASYFITNDKPEQDAGIQKLWVAIGGARLSQNETLNNALAKVRKSIDDPSLPMLSRTTSRFRILKSISRKKQT
jgi:BMFP domain-containing protein YqiC